MTVRVLVTNGLVKDEGLRVPSDGRFVQIRHDWEVYKNGMPRQFEDSKPKYPYPAVVNKDFGLLTKYNGRVYDYVELQDEWQWFLWNFWDWASGYALPRGRIEKFYRKKENPTPLFAETTKGSLTWVYVNMIEDARSHTDSWSAEVGARDVVTGRNLNARNYEWLCRPTTGQVLKVKRDMGSRWEVEAIDMLKPAPSMREMEEKIWLWGWATEITTTKIGNRYIVSDYAQIDQALKVHNPNSPRTGTPIPLLSLGGSFEVDKRACRELVNGAAWSPYVPEK